MYLNVTLTPPSSGEGLCTTPKTPEILNSLISLTSPPLPPSYSYYHNQVRTGELLSPTSTVSTPSDEVAGSLSQYGNNTCPSLCRSGRHYSGSSSDGSSTSSTTGGYMGGSPGTSGGVSGPLAGASPPNTPDLPSPINTLQATRTALIKEGLKYQIKTKLQAAGLGSDDLLIDSKSLKEEDLHLYQLTYEDSERRKRRRERNKIAATKCRNKKKEKTMILMTESESVEDQNIRLKTEIQRLTNEKMNLEKLLKDPNHQASCCHHPRCSSVPDSDDDVIEQLLPLVVVTPPDESEVNTSTYQTAKIPNSLCSPQSSRVCYPSPNTSPNTSRISPEFESDSINSCMLSVISHSSPPSPLSNLSNRTSGDVPTAVSCSSKSPSSENHLSNLPVSSVIKLSPNNSLISPVITPICNSLNNNTAPQQTIVSDVPNLSPLISPTSEFISPKCRPGNAMSSRYHPYQYGNNSFSPENDSNNFSNSSHMGPSLHENKQYCSGLVSNVDNPKFQYDSNFSNEFVSPDLISKNLFLASKSRAANMARYSPYNCAGRQQNYPIDNHNNVHQMRNMESMESYDHPSGCSSQGSSASYMTEQQNIYYSSSCSFRSLCE